MAYMTRLAKIDDLPSITKIYNEGIENKTATLETRPRTLEDMEKWFLDRSDRHKVVVITDDSNIIYGWASLNIFNPRACYSGVADISIYVKGDLRGRGLGKRLMNYLTDVAKTQDFHKLVLYTFAINKSGKKLYTSTGFREVGTYKKQGILDGKWIDITVMEKLLI